MKRWLPGLALLLSICLALVACGPTVPVITVAQIPWADGEITSYAVQDSQGTELGTLNMTIRREGDLYLMTSFTMMGNTTDEITIAMNADDLKPTSETRTIHMGSGGPVPGGTYDIIADFSDNQVIIEADLPGNDHQEPYVFNIPADSYANDQVWYLFRTLPFEEGYAGRYTNIVLWTQFQKPAVTVTVVGNETVETPAGIFDCHKLELSVLSLTIYFWYGVEAPHYLVKYQKGDTILLLTEHP